MWCISLGIGTAIELRELMHCGDPCVVHQLGDRHMDRIQGTDALWGFLWCISFGIGTGVDLRGLMHCRDPCVSSASLLLQLVLHPSYHCQLHVTCTKSSLQASHFGLIMAVTVPAAHLSMLCQRIQYPTFTEFTIALRTAWIMHVHQH